MCEAQIPRKEGAKKGNELLRCRLRASAVQRLDYAATTDAQKAALRKVEPLSCRIQSQGHEGAQSMARGGAAMSQLGEYLEATAWACTSL